MTVDPAVLEDARSLFAAVLSRVSGRHLPDIERSFQSTRREDFFPAGPWSVYTAAGYVPTPSASPLWLQQNVLIAIDAEKGINNGEPSLHAAWLAAVGPKLGEKVLHVGCGNGFYTAILASLVGETGSVEAFEIEPDIAKAAALYLARYPRVRLHPASGVAGPLPDADVIYVNAASVEPLANWLAALRPGGRLVFPWQVDPDRGVSALVTREAHGFAARILGPSRFIPLRGKVGTPGLLGDRGAVSRIVALIDGSDRQPDETCVAAFERYWFSTASLSPSEEAKHG